MDWRRLPRRYWWIIGGLGLVALVALWQIYQGHRSPGAFLTVKVGQGDLRAVISATGTVEPEEVIDVGAQVAGKIVAFGQDKDGQPVDYGSLVEVGTVLAQIDDALYAAEAAQARAGLQHAKSDLQSVRANLKQLKAKLVQARLEWQRAQKLGPSDALSQSDFDAARSAFEVALANYDVGQAAIAKAEDAVALAAATLRRADQNLSYCTIKSPVKGVIIDRRVNIGQTVVASLSAPSLFLLAKDLKRLQIWASVNEADIGNIHPGQPVTFTVDAYPGVVFTGEVRKVRYNATMTQNVVTYIVEVTTDNPDGKLLPYLTANVKFLVCERRGVLKVPNAALRWKPKMEQVREQFRADLIKAHQHGKSARKGNPGRGVLWVPEGSLVKPLPVQIGITDGSQTEIQGEGLTEGLSVVVGLKAQGSEKSDQSGSPFAPKLLKGKGH
ncbi:MAG: efflux RND transporter periplasmic adaptor subunit [Desulfobacca sp.]|nr:efflux RND transporter periplasmic adaptor subunit [Desulfobacca sp.]